MTIDFHRLFVVCALALAALALSRIVADRGNPLEWWHLIATKGADGHHYLDNHKFIEIVVLLVASIAVIVTALHDKMDSFTLGTFLAFGAGSSGYSAYLRSKRPETPANGGNAP